MADGQARDQEVAELKGSLARALETIGRLEQRIAELECQLRSDSSNSSKPPSTDPPGKKRPIRPRTGRAQGGQKGHKGSFRALVPPQRVTRFVRLKPSQCRECHRRLRGQDPRPLRHQVAEVPRISIEVTEYECHALTCSSCGTVTRAMLPPGLRGKHFGERLTALSGQLVGMAGLTIRQVQRVMEDLLGIHVSVGQLWNAQQEISTALKRPFNEVAREIRVEPVVHIDETGWAQGRMLGRKRQAWLWAAATPSLSLFSIRPGRSRKEADEILGRTFPGVLVSDDYSVYRHIRNERHQLCHAHILRHLQEVIDARGSGGRIAHLLQIVIRAAISASNRARDGTLAPARFNKIATRLKRRAARLLAWGRLSLDPLLASKLKRWRSHWMSLWLFLDNLAVPPTNNEAERTLRPAVIYRKRSFGTQTRAGSRFVERILTASTTLRRQGRNVLDFLEHCLKALRAGNRGPSLLPL